MSGRGHGLDAEGDLSPYDYSLLKEDGAGNLLVVGSALQFFPAINDMRDGGVTDFVDHFGGFCFG